MKRLNTLYTLLVIVAMTFTVACDDSDEITTDMPEAGETTAGEPMAGETTAGEPMAGEPMAGEPMAGEPMAGEPMAGEPMAGEPMAGEPMAGAMMERVGPGDTDAISCMGDYCPSARLSALSLPGSPDEAAAAGCRLASAKNGTALGGLLALAGGSVDTNSFVQPDENGEIQLVLLNHLKNWADGASGNDAGSLSSNFYTGVQEGADAFSIDPISFDEAGNPIIFFSDTMVTDGLYHTPASDFIVDLPIAGLPLQLRLSQTEVTGFVTTDNVGFNMTEGVLGGYLTKDAIVSLIDGIGAVCASDMPPELCGTVSSVLTGDTEADLQTLLLVLGGFDSAVSSDGNVSACAGDSPDCNAVSVCILLEMSSTAISGIATEE